MPGRVVHDDGEAVRAHSQQRCGEVRSSTCDGADALRAIAIAEIIEHINARDLLRRQCDTVRASYRQGPSQICCRHGLRSPVMNVKKGIANARRERRMVRSMPWPVFVIAPIGVRVSHGTVMLTVRATPRIDGLWVSIAATRKKYSPGSSSVCVKAVSGAVVIPIDTKFAPRSADRSMA